MAILNPQLTPRSLTFIFRLLKNMSSFPGTDAGNEAAEDVNEVGAPREASSGKREAQISSRTAAAASGSRQPPRKMHLLGRSAPSDALGVDGGAAGAAATAGPQAVEIVSDDSDLEEGGTRGKSPERQWLRPGARGGVGARVGSDYQANIPLCAGGGGRTQTVPVSNSPMEESTPNCE